MSDRSLQVSVEDLQHIQVHLEGQERALAAIAEHLRAFDADAGQFTDFQRDFIKTIGLIQDVHQYTKQQANQWREQLEQCATVHQNTLRLQTDIAPQFTASADRFAHELQTSLEQQQHYFEKLKTVMTEHESLLSNHSSIELFKEVPDLIHQMSQRLNNALIQVRAFEFDARQFTDFQRDFIKTIGLVQDVHEYTKQQANQWREQLEQCVITQEHTLRLQANIGPRFTASADRFAHELQTSLEQQQHYFEKLKTVMTEHESLLSNHQSIELFKQVPDLIRHMSQRLNNALTQMDVVAVGLSQLIERNEKDISSQTLIDQQLDQRFSDLSNIVQQSLEQLRQDQIDNHALQQRVLRAGFSLVALLLVILIFL